MAGFTDFCEKYKLPNDFLSSFYVDVLMDLGWKAQDEQNWESLEKISSRIIELEPENEEFLFLKGQSLYNQDPSSDNAIICYDKVISNGGERVLMALWGKSLIRYFQGNLNDALSCCNKALEISPNNPNLMNVKDSIMDAMNKNKSYSAALDMHTVNDLMKKADELVKTGLYEQSLEYYDKILQINPTPYIWIKKADVFTKQGKIKESFECFEMAQSLETGQKIDSLYQSDTKKTSEWIND